MRTSTKSSPVPSLLPPTSPPTSYQKQAPRSMWDDVGALVVGKVAAGSVVAPHPPLHRSRSRFRSHWSGWRHAAAGSPPVTPPSSRFPEACLKQTCRRTFFPLWPCRQQTRQQQQQTVNTTSPPPAHVLSDCPVSNTSLADYLATVSDVGVGRHIYM